MPKQGRNWRVISHNSHLCFIPLESTNKSLAHNLFQVVAVTVEIKSNLQNSASSEMQVRVVISTRLHEAVNAYESMWPDWVKNPGPLTFESDALPHALCDLAMTIRVTLLCVHVMSLKRQYQQHIFKSK